MGNFCSSPVEEKEIRKGSVVFRVSDLPPGNISATSSTVLSDTTRPRNSSQLSSTLSSTSSASPKSSSSMTTTPIKRKKRKPRKSPRKKTTTTNSLSTDNVRWERRSSDSIMKAVDNVHDVYKSLEAKNNPTNLGVGPRQNSVSVSFSKNKPPLVYPSVALGSISDKQLSKDAFTYQERIDAMYAKVESTHRSLSNISLSKTDDWISPVVSRNSSLMNLNHLIDGSRRSSIDDLELIWPNQREIYTEMADPLIKMPYDEQKDKLKASRKHKRKMAKHRKNIKKSASNRSLKKSASSRRPKSSRVNPRKRSSSVDASKINKTRLRSSSADTPVSRKAAENVRKITRYPSNKFKNIKSVLDTGIKKKKRKKRKNKK